MLASALVHPNMNVIIPTDFSFSFKKSFSKGFLGRKAILNSSPFSYPKEVKKSSRPLCYSKSFESIKKKNI